MIGGALSYEDQPFFDSSIFSPQGTQVPNFNLIILWEMGESVRVSEDFLFAK